MLYVVGIPGIVYFVIMFFINTDIDIDLPKFEWWVYLILGISIATIPLFIYLRPKKDTYHV